jgi:predicted nucleic acid-binding protein
VTVLAFAPPLYLLDTNILVHYVRGDRVQRHVEATCHLLMTPTVPLISYITEAEVRSLAVQFGWGTARTNQLVFLLATFPRVHIHEPGMVDAYVAIDTYSLSVGIEMGKNDLWIAAAAHVTGATLLTTDRDFDPLDGRYLQRDWIDPTL